MEQSIPQEGQIYEIAKVGGHVFTIRYGYYNELERGATEPLPIYPCFLTDPHYTAAGAPLVTRIQDACEHYLPSSEGEGDGWCADCKFCAGTHDAIGICQSPHRQKTV